MALNARTKGQEGEREIARDLNAIVDELLVEFGLARQDPGKPRIQRNQQQSAVGGCDLVGTFGLAIEVKRQEQLSINTWWAQCVASAQKLGEEPVLLFRQNAKPGQRTKWRCMLMVDLEIPGSEALATRAEIDYDAFLMWFKNWAREHMRSELRVPSKAIAQVAPKIVSAAPDLYSNHS